MQAPKKRQSKSRRNMRRAHDFLTPSYLSKCNSCGAPVKPFHVCLACGYYRGKQIINISKSENASV